MTFTWYLIAVVAVSTAITFALRAVPFAILAKLRGSRFVKAMGKWMPVGIMFVLAAVTTRDAVTTAAERWWITPVALAVTVAVHFATKRRTMWSVAAGTACYILLLNFTG